ncbi:MAG: Sua5/YciO/YrdC/YwlC family protein [Mycoplasmataceae bacterium]|nr:Sua5/YciO/YrdC/YwlC family protein [Mycoplasmataceae bacterium]
MKSKYAELFLTTTDTVTGIGAPVSQEGIEALLDLKDREPDKGFIIMVGSIEQAKKLKGWNDKAAKMAEEFWPGQTTLALSDKVAVRMPDNLALRDLIIAKGPVYMTSANVSDEKPLGLWEAKEVFYEVKKFYDFGKGTGKPSAIIRVSDGEVLR